MAAGLGWPTETSRLPRRPSTLTSSRVLEVDRGVADAEIGHLDLVEPVGQRRPQPQALVRGVWLEAGKRAEEWITAPDAQVLRDVSAEVLNRKRAFVARKTAVDLRKAPILKSSGGIEQPASDPASLGAMSVTAESVRENRVVVSPSILPPDCSSAPPPGVAARNNHSNPLCRHAVRLRVAAYRSQDPPAVPPNELPDKCIVV